MDTDGALAETHRVDSTRGHLLEMAGDYDEALAAYRRAAARTRNEPERRYLKLRPPGCATAPVSRPVVEAALTRLQSRMLG